MDIDTGGGIWSIAIIVGPILLAIVLLWAVMHNRTSRRQRRDTEEATRELYHEENERDRLRDGD